MVTKKSKKAVKKRRPKGKRLSESLREKDDKKGEKDEKKAAADEEILEEESLEEEGGATDLASEPPPAFDEDGEELAEPEGEGEEGEREPESERDDEDEDEDAEEEAGDEEGEDDEWEYEDEEVAAAQMGTQRYVQFGFLGLWLVVGYVLGRAFELLWSNLAAKDFFVRNLPRLAAVPHEGELISRSSVSLVLGGLVAGGIVLRYFRDAGTRKWADEVAEELSKVRWPTRKEIGNHTVVCIASSAVLTLYLALLDRFWAYVTNLIYSTGT